MYKRRWRPDEKTIVQDTETAIPCCKSIVDELQDEVQKEPAGNGVVPGQFEPVDDKQYVVFGQKQIRQA